MGEEDEGEGAFQEGCIMICTRSACKVLRCARTFASRIRLGTGTLQFDRFSSRRLVFCSRPVAKMSKATRGKGACETWDGRMGKSGPLAECFNLVLYLPSQSRTRPN